MTTTTTTAPSTSYRLSTGEIIPATSTGYALGGRALRKATVEILLEEGIVVRAAIRSVTGRKASCLAVVSPTVLVEYADGSYGCSF